MAILESIAQARQHLENTQSALMVPLYDNGLEAAESVYLDNLCADLTKRIAHLHAMERAVAARTSQKETLDVVSQHGHEVLALCRLIRRMSADGADAAAIKSYGVRFLRGALAIDYSPACALFDYIMDVYGVAPD